jgi:hypothetical protein
MSIDSGPSAVKNDSSRVSAKVPGRSIGQAILNVHVNGRCVQSKLDSNLCGNERKTRASTYKIEIAMSNGWSMSALAPKADTNCCLSDVR